MKLIDKDALVSEIRKRLLPVIRDKHYDEWEEGQNSERQAILDIINALEVKEVDFDKEIDIYSNALPCRRDDIETIAKHFFELGMRQSKNHNNNEE